MQDGFRSLGAPGLGAHQATQAILALLEGRGGFTVCTVAPGRISIASSRRPRWAVLACIATIWIAGLGLLFLLVRRTEAGEITVSDGPRGCVITLPPLIDAATGQAISDAVAPATHVVAAPASPVDGDDLEDRTVARTEVPAFAHLPPPPSSPGSVPSPVAPLAPEPIDAGSASSDGPHRSSAVELRFRAGAIAVRSGEPVILGREPSPSGAARACPVLGDASTVSKSHLRVVFDGTAVTVEDLGSTNGSRLRAAATGAEVGLVPGSPTVAGPGDTVTLGALEFVVSPAASAADAAPLLAAADREGGAA